MAGDRRRDDIILGSRPMISAKIVRYNQLELSAVSTHQQSRHTGALPNSTVILRDEVGIKALLRARPGAADLKRTDEVRQRWLIARAEVDPGLGSDLARAGRGAK